MALIISPSKTQRATGVRGKNAHQSNKLREAHRGDSSGGRSYEQGRNHGSLVISGIMTYYKTMS